jgi:hypothetical protein
MIGMGILMIILIVPVSLYLGSQGIISWSTIAVVPIIVLAIFFGIFRASQQQQKSWKSYQLIFDGDTIKRTQDGYQEIVFPRSSISRIIELPGQFINVQPTNASLQIVIPYTVENYEEIRTILEQWHSIEVQVKSSTIFATSPFLIVIAVIALFAGTMISTNVYVVTTLGGILLTMLVASLVVIYTNHNTPTQTKRSAWLVIFPILAIAVRIYAALTGMPW